MQSESHGVSMECCDCSMQLVTFPERVPGMAAKALLSTAESGGAGFSKLITITVRSEDLSTLVKILGDSHTQNRERPA